MTAKTDIESLDYSKPLPGHDRRRAIILDIDDQTCSSGKHLGEWMAAVLVWTDAECTEVEAYAALAFPRWVDMPAPLQRVLLPQAPT